MAMVYPFISKFLKHKHNSKTKYISLEPLGQLLFQRRESSLLHCKCFLLIFRSNNDCDFGSSNQHCTCDEAEQKF